MNDAITDKVEEYWNSKMCVWILCIYQTKISIQLCHVLGGCVQSLEMIAFWNFKNMLRAAHIYGW